MLPWFRSWLSLSWLHRSLSTLGLRILSCTATVSSILQQPLLCSVAHPIASFTMLSYLTGKEAAHLSVELWPLCLGLQDSWVDTLLTTLDEWGHK